MKILKKCEPQCRFLNIGLFGWYFILFLFFYFFNEKKERENFENFFSIYL